MTLSSRLLLALSIAPILTAQSQFSTDLLALSPLGYWPLHGNPNDSSGHGNNGTLNNGVGFTSFVGPLGTAAGSAAVFDSAQSQFLALSVPGSSSFNFGNLRPFTAMAWIRTENQGLPLEGILGKADQVSGTGWFIGIDNGGIGGPAFGGRLGLFFFAANNLTLGVETTVSVTDGGWHLVAATYDGSGLASGVKLYVDGVALATTSLVDKVSTGSILNTGPLTVGAGSDGSSAFEGNINEAAVFGVALTSAQNLQLAEDAIGFKRILPQFAFGGGWYSAIYLTNGGTASVSFPVSFTGDNGLPLTVPSISASSTTITLAPGASTKIEAPNVGPLTQGYVSMTLPVGVTGYGVFRQSVPGVADQEAVVPLSVATAGFASLVYDETNNLVTAVAIANTSSVTTTVTITAFDSTGTVIGTFPLTMQPFTKTEAILHSYAGLGGMVGKQGTVQFALPAQTTSTPTGFLSVLGLRADGLALTSVPTVGRPGI